MKRYDFDELTKHECSDGEWVKASEAEDEIAALIKQIEVASLRIGILQTENDNLRNALYCIRVNSYYCNSCSASMYAEDALEEGTRDEFAEI